MRRMRYTAMVAVAWLVGHGPAQADEQENAAADRKYAECSTLSHALAQHFDQETFEKLNVCHSIYNTLAARASGCTNGADQDDCISKWRINRDLVTNPEARALLGRGNPTVQLPIAKPTAR